MITASIIDEIFKYDLNHGFEKDDIVLVCYTSSLRDRPSWIPNTISKNTHNGILVLEKCFDI